MIVKGFCSGDDKDTLKPTVATSVQLKGNVDYEKAAQTTAIWGSREASHTGLGFP